MAGVHASSTTAPRFGFAASWRSLTRSLESKMLIALDETPGDIAKAETHPPAPTAPMSEAGYQVHSDPAALVAELAADLGAGRPPNPTAAATFAEAVGRWLRGEVGSLDQGLRLGGAPGLEGGRRRFLEARRDAHLAAARDLLDGTPWRRLEDLATEIKRFEAVIWPRWSSLGGPPASASKLRHHLYRARELSGRPLPKTAQGLAKRLTQLPPHRKLVKAGRY